MPSQQSNKLASQIPDKLRSYRGPLDLAWVVSVAQRWQQVWDTGSTRNKHRAAELGCSTWVDLYTKRPVYSSENADIYLENW
jgi:hypothetical protein